MDDNKKALSYYKKFSNLKQSDYNVVISKKYNFIFAIGYYILLFALLKKYIFINIYFSFFLLLRLIENNDILVLMFSVNV